MNKNIKPYFYLLFFIGLSLHVFAASQTWIASDQAHLLRLGAKLASEGTIVPFGKLLNGGGTNPGILLQLLFGIPMYITHHFQSPMILVILSHCLAFALLSGIFKKTYGDAVLIPFTLVYWLSSWRIHNAGLLWEPAFIFLPAALHLWCSYNSRDKKSLLYSALGVASVVWAMQIHNSFMILLVASIILVWKKRIQIHWGGILLGVCVAGLTLIPSIVAIATGNLQYDTQQSQGFIGKGLVTVVPMLKGVLYWFTLGGIDAVRALKETSFSSTAPIIIYILQFLCILTVGISIVASWWYFRPLWRWKGKRPEDHQVTESAQWMRSYAIAIFFAIIISAALSPITLQGWQVVIALHAAIIPVVVWAIQVWKQKRSARTVLISAIVYAAFEIAIMLTIVSGQSIYNRTSDLPNELDPVKDAIVLEYIPKMK
jgi:hypothetical protein